MRALFYGCFPQQRVHRLRTIQNTKSSRNQIGQLHRCSPAHEELLATDFKWDRVYVDNGRPLPQRSQRQFCGRINNAGCTDRKKKIAALSRRQSSGPFNLRKHFTEPDNTRPYQPNTSTAVWWIYTYSTFLHRQCRQHLQEGRQAFNATRGMKTAVEMDDVLTASALM